MQHRCKLILLHRDKRKRLHVWLPHNQAGNRKHGGIQNKQRQGKKQGKYQHDTNHYVIEREPPGVTSQKSGCEALQMNVYVRTTWHSIKYGDAPNPVLSIHWCVRSNLASPSFCRLYES